MKISSKKANKRRMMTMTINKKQIQDKIDFEAKMLSKYRAEKQDMIDGKIEKDCLIECMEFMTEARLTLLQELMEEYFKQRVYSKCIHCGTRWIKQPDEDKDMSCPKCHYPAFRVISI